MHCTVIIPAYRPPEQLPTFLNSLQEKGFSDIILIDDGSGEDYRHIFQSVETDSVTILYHSSNQGKGEALKTGFRHCLRRNDQPDIIITADCDGQHQIDDILKLFYTIKTDSQTVFLGIRSFHVNTPLRSRIGNQTAAGILRLFYGINLGDTQTGLRAFPGTLLPRLANIPGKRYEYETNVLIDMAKNREHIKTVEIQTIYKEHNAGSHYRPIRDSLRVTAAMLPHFRRKQ